LPHSKLAIREYNREDFPAIVELYEHIPGQTPHFVRDKDFISYFINKASAEGNVFVAIEKGKVVGVAMVSITTEEELTQGSIIELQAQDTRTLKDLVESAVDYCTKRAVDMVLFAPPFDTEDVFKNWLKLQTGVMTVRLEAPLLLLKALLDTPQTRNSFAGRRIIFQVDKEIIEVKITSKGIETIQRDTSVRGVTNIALSSRALLQIVCGKLSPLRALLTLKLRTRLTAIALVLKLLKMARLPQPWFIPLGDRL